MTRIIVTGGLGVIGAPLVRRLARTGADLQIWDVRSDSGLLGDVADDVEIASLDVTDSQIVSKRISQFIPDCVVHLAGLVSFAAINANLRRAYEINVGGTVNVLDAAVRSGVRRVVFASSKAVYGHLDGRHGHPHYEPVAESRPPAPVNAYDHLKYAGELAGHVYSNEHDLEFVALRFGTIFGPGKQRRHGHAGLFSHLVEAAHRGEAATVAKGGDQFDDLVYVADAVHGVALAIEVDHVPSRAYNIASGRACSVRDFAEAVRHACPWAEISITGGRLNEAVSYRGVLDISLARRELGYEPRFDLEAAIRDYRDVLRTVST